MITLVSSQKSVTPNIFTGSVWISGILGVNVYYTWDTNICLQANLSFGLQMASIIGLYLTIITHLVFSELRNLPGLNLLAMNTNMVLYQQLFLGTIHILRKQVLGLFLTNSLREHDSCHGPPQWAFNPHKMSLWGRGSTWVLTQINFHALLFI